MENIITQFLEVGPLPKDQKLFLSFLQKEIQYILKFHTVNDSPPADLSIFLRHALS